MVGHLYKLLVDEDQNYLFHFQYTLLIPNLTLDLLPHYNHSQILLTRAANAAIDSPLKRDAKDKFDAVVDV